MRAPPGYFHRVQMPFRTLWLTGNALGFRAGHQPPPRGPKHCLVLAGTCWTRACVSCRASSSESLSAKPCSLFLPNYIQDKYLLQLLRSADDVSTWVAAEIVTSHTSKVGAQGSGPSTGSWVPAVRAPPWASTSAGGAQRPLCQVGCQSSGHLHPPASACGCARTEVAQHLCPEE